MQRNRWSVEKIFSTPINEHLLERSRPHNDMDKNSFYILLTNSTCLLPFLFFAASNVSERTAKENVISDCICGIWRPWLIIPYYPSFLHSSLVENRNAWEIKTLPSLISAALRHVNHLTDRALKEWTSQYMKWNRYIWCDSDCTPRPSHQQPVPGSFRRPIALQVVLHL